LGFAGLWLVGITARGRDEGGVVFPVRNPDGSDSTLDQVVALQVRRPDPAPVDPRPVGASHVEAPALGRIGGDQKMVSQDVLALNRQPIVGFLVPANDTTVVLLERETPILMRSSHDRQRHFDGSKIPPVTSTH
jgi:hypothetical protein